MLDQNLPAVPRLSVVFGKNLPDDLVLSCRECGREGFLVDLLSRLAVDEDYAKQIPPIIDVLHGIGVDVESFADLFVNDDGIYNYSPLVLDVPVVCHVFLQEWKGAITPPHVEITGRCSRPRLPSRPRSAWDPKPWGIP